MPTSTPAIHHASDERLLFPLAAVVFGLILAGISAVDRQPSSGPTPRELAGFSFAKESAHGTDLPSLASKPHREIAARVRNPRILNRWHGDRNFLVTSIPHHRTGDDTDSCRDLLMLTILGRRISWQHPGGHYTPPEPDLSPVCGAGSTAPSRKRDPHRHNAPTRKP
jgi:hypothetical protein